MKIAPAIRIGLTILGIALVVIAFAGVLGVGVVANRPPLRIAVALRDLSQGERLSDADVRLVDQVLDPALARLYVQDGDLPRYLGGYVVDVVRRGDPLNRVKIATGQDALGNRYSLVLTDTDDVVMVLPVNPDLIPSKVAAGDFVNIAYFVGSDSNLQLPDATPAAPSLVYGVPAVTPALPGLKATDVPTDSPTPQLVMPVADLMLEHVPVLDVNYEQVQNPNAMGGSQGGEPLYVNGPIKSIVVRVPRSHQTVLTFASAAGRVRYAIASPLDQPAAMRPRGVVDWKRMVDLLRWKEEQAALHGETITQSLYPAYTPLAPVFLAPTATASPAPLPPALPTAAPIKKP